MCVIFKLVCETFFFFLNRDCYAVLNICLNYTLMAYHKSCIQLLNVGAVSMGTAYDYHDAWSGAIEILYCIHSGMFG